MAEMQGAPAPKTGSAAKRKVGALHLFSSQRARLIPEEPWSKCPLTSVSVVN